MPSWPENVGYGAERRRRLPSVPQPCVLIPTLNSRILAPFDGCISLSTYTRHARKNPRDRLKNLSWGITELNSEQLDRTTQMKNDAICARFWGDIHRGLRDVSVALIIHIRRCIDAYKYCA